MRHVKLPQSVDIIYESHFSGERPSIGEKRRQSDVLFLQPTQRTAITKPQFATGPQKWVVLGPVGLDIHF